MLVSSYWQFVGDKVAYALSQGLKVIACVGETLEQRESGSTMDVVAAQTKAIAGNFGGHLDYMALVCMLLKMPVVLDLIATYLFSSIQT